LRVDRYARISVRTNRYSVPVRLIGRRVRVMLHASELVVYDGQTEVARHDRLIAKAGSRLELDHTAGHRSRAGAGAGHGLPARVGVGCQDDVDHVG
jgi:hypothetical protein